MNASLPRALAPFLAVALALSPAPVLAGRAARISPETHVRLLDGDEGRRAILEDERDPFFRVLSPIDLELRLGRPVAPAEREAAMRLLRKQFADAVAPWTDAEAEEVVASCRRVLARAREVCPAFVPEQWAFVKTDGTEEAGAAYTRDRSIVLPAQKLARTRPLDRLIAHETAHVFSRAHPGLRDRLYARLGFRRVGAIQLPAGLDRRRITNPDAPTNEHVIRVGHPSMGEFDAALVTYSKHESFDPLVGRRLFAYLESKLFPVQLQERGARVLAPESGGAAGYSVSAVRGFFEQVGRNTSYTIHPEEILAENLALVMTTGDGAGAGAVPSPDLLRDLERILREAAGP